MDEQQYEELSEFLQKQVGDALRGVIAYDGDEQQTIYLREDVRAEHSAAYGSRVADVFRAQHRDRTDVLEALEFTDESASLQIFDEALVIHFMGDGEGAIIKFDPDVGRNLVQFIDTCRHHLSY